MFTDYEEKTVEFLSSWKSEKKLRENGSQTSETLTYEVESQTNPPRDATSQTESLIQLMKNSMHLNADYNTTTLTNFLKEAEPLVSKQIKVNNSAHSLYSNIYKRRENLFESSITCEHTLIDQNVIKQSSNENLEATCVSWSSSGASVAVSYGTNENISWSDSRSFVCIWNLDRPKLNTKSCDQKLELDSSVQVISFHPQFSRYVAVGMFSGVVAVWDLVNEELVYGESNHEDPTTCLCWLDHKNNKYLRLLSASTDGQLKLWRCKKGASTNFKMEKNYQITAAKLPRRVGVKGRGAIGITSFCTIPIDVGSGIIHQQRAPHCESLIVGCENGSVLKCSIEVEDLNPITFAYDNHIGPVYSIDWSPFHRHLFLTCSTDQVCRIYHSLQTSPLREIRAEEATGGRMASCLYFAAWSRSRPCLFFSGGTRGRLEACNVKTSKSVSFCDVNGLDGKADVINSFATNFARIHWVATASSQGVAHVWKLGSRLVESDDVMKEETMFLNDIANDALGTT